MTNEQIKQDCISRMGAKFGAIFHRLQAEYQHCLDRWRPYRSLYGSGPERIELLNKADSDFFGRMQQVMWEDTLLGIARLVDTNKRTVSLLRLPSCLPMGEQRERIANGLVPVIAACSFAREWRHNYIAHRSEQVALNREANSLPDASREHIEKAFDHIGIFLNLVDQDFGGNVTAWEFYRRDFTNPNRLMYVISDGLRHEERRKRRFTEGTYTDEDVRFRYRLWNSGQDSENS